jgi:hypothetical protein
MKKILLYFLFLALSKSFAQVPYSPAIANYSTNKELLLYVLKVGVLPENSTKILLVHDSSYAYWNTKMFVGGTTTPTARLHLAAGTATAGTAPLKGTAGALLTTIEPLTKEYGASGTYNSTVALNRYAEGGPIADFTTDVSNTGTGETDLYSYTTKASTLSETGEKITFTYTVNVTDITSTAQIQCYFGGTVIGNTGALAVNASGAIVVSGWIIRTGASTARASVNISSPTAGTSLYTSETDLTGLTFTNTNILKITGTAGGVSGGTGDITAKLGTISWFGASNNN